MRVLPVALAPLEFVADVQLPGEPGTTEIRGQRVQFLDTKRGGGGGQYQDDYQAPPQGRAPQQNYQGGQGPQDQGGGPQQGDQGGRDDGPIFPSEIDEMPF